MSALSYHNLKGESIGGPKILDGQEDFGGQVEILGLYQFQGVMRDP
jgi:hypothetical protein